MILESDTKGFGSGGKIVPAEPIIVPPLKWAGGKRWLIQSKLLPIPAFSRYVEPFFGSGAVYFSLRPDHAIISDANRELIETYAAIRDRPDLVERYLRTHQNKHGSAHYYSTRAKVYRSRFQRAARFLYLNRTCWNGLYKVNKSGVFNVPIGTKTAVLQPTDNFRAVSELLSNANLCVNDFETTIDLAGEHDFIFADPPYTTAHNTNGFVKYNQTIFSWQDQVRLANAISRAVERGAKVALTNADHESVRNLYADIMTPKRLSRASIIASDATHRRKTTELLYLSHA